MLKKRRDLTLKTNMEEKQKRTSLHQIGPNHLINQKVTDNFNWGGSSRNILKLKSMVESCRRVPVYHAWRTNCSGRRACSGGAHSGDARGCSGRANS